MNIARTTVVGVLMAGLLLATAGCQMTPPGRSTNKTKSDEAHIASLRLTSLFGPSATTAPATKPKINSEAMMAYFQAKSQILEKDQKGALENLEKSVALAPTYLPARILLMQMYYEQGQSTLARKHAEAILAQDADDAMANFVLGSALLGTDDLMKAGRYLHRAMVLWSKPDQPPTFEGMLAAFKLGGALSGRGYFQAAMDVYGPLLVRMDQVAGDPTITEPRIRKLVEVYRPGLYLLQGDFALRLNRPAEALAHFQKAETISEAKVSARMGIVRSFAVQGKVTEAGKLLDTLAREQGVDEALLGLYQRVYPDGNWASKVAEVYKADAKNLGLGINLAEELVRQGKDNPAASVLQPILALDPSNSRALWLLVRCFEKSGKMDRAAAALYEVTVGSDNRTAAIPIALKNTDVTLGTKLVAALKKMPVEPDGRYARDYLLGVASQTAGSFSAAGRHYLSSLELRKDFLPAFLAWGQLLIQQRQWAEASKLMDQALDRKLKNPGIYYVRGIAMFEEDRIDQAIRSLEEARKLNPQSDQTLLALAEAYLRSDESNKAFDLLKQMIANSLTGPQTLSRLVQMLLEADSGALAESVLQQYGQRFGQEGDFKLLAAKVNYLKDLNASRYRGELEALGKSGLRSAALERERAELEFNLGNYETAISLVNQSLASDTLLGPRDYQRLVQIQAFSYWKLLDYPRAQASWQTLASTWPNQRAIRLGMARMYLDAQWYERAEAEIRPLAASEKKDEVRAQLQLWLITCLMGQDRLTDALDALDGWMIGAGKDDRARFIKMKIECLNQAQRYDEAAKLLENLVALKEPPWMTWRQMLVATYLLADQPERALQWIDGNLKTVEAKDRRGLETLKVSVLARVKRFDDAVTLAKRLLASADAEQKFSSTIVLINTLQQAGRFDEAIAVARTAQVGEAADSVFALSLAQQIAMTLEQAGKYDQAEAFIRDRMAESKPAARNQWQQLLVALCMNRGKTDVAIKTLEEILATNPNLGWANNSLGYALADRGKDLARAEQLIRKALATEPGSGAFLDSLAWAYYRQGKYNEAYRYGHMSRRALGADIDPVILDHLGDICVKAGKRQEAVDHYRRAIRFCANRDPGSLEPDMPQRTIQKLKALEKKAVPLQ